MKLKIFLSILVFLLFAASVYVFFVLGKSIDKQRNHVDLKKLPEISEKAQNLHAELIIADWHADPLLWDRNLLKRINYGMIDIPRLIEGNYTLQVFAAVTKSPSGQNYYQNKTNVLDNITFLAIANRWPVRTWSSLCDRALYQSNKLYRTEKKSRGKFIVITSKKELKELISLRKSNADIVGGVLAIEGLHALEGKISNFDRLYNTGYRIMGLTHFFDNKVGGSSSGVSKGGLTEFGKEVIRRIKEKSVIIDLAHASPQLISDVSALSNRPVIVSHSGAKSINNSPRNLSDAEIRLIASKGGLIGVGFWNEAVVDIHPQSIVRSIKHMVTIAGIDHVSLGSDFDGSVHTYFDASQIILLTDALMDEGFSNEEIKKIMGGNQIRFLLKYLPDN